MGNPQYPLELFQRVITVSLETMKIVKGLPALDELVKAANSPHEPSDVDSSDDGKLLEDQRAAIEKKKVSSQRVRGRIERFLCSSPGLGQ